MKIVYVYHPSTLVFLNSLELHDGDLSPLEPGFYIIPGNCCEIEPPDVMSSHVAVATIGDDGMATGWIMKPDWRDARLFSRRDGSLITIEAVGILPEDVGATELEPPSPYHAFDDVTGRWVESPVLLSTFKAVLMSNIDNVFAGIYGQWLRFEAEYVAREAAARVFKQAGYVGDPGVWVESFATNTGKTSTEATNVIIEQADGLRSALVTLAAARMRKYSVAAAVSWELAQQEHDDIVTQATTIAASLQ